MRSVVTITLALATTALCVSAGADTQVQETSVSHNIVLDSPVHFLGPDESDVLVEPGTYWVDTLVGSQLRLQAVGKEPLFVEAQATSHDEALEGPVAPAVPIEEDTLHVVLLLPSPWHV